jgi:hypothetical protein
MFSVPAYAFPVATVALYKSASINYVTMQVADAPETHWLQAAQRMCFSDIQVGGCCTSRYHLVLLISLEAGEGATCYLRPPVESICGPGPHNRSNIIIDICSSANLWATAANIHICQSRYPRGANWRCTGTKVVGLAELALVLALCWC